METKQSKNLVKLKKAHKDKVVAALGAAALGIITFTLTFPTSMWIACEISPPYIIDPETGQELHVMATGQIFISLIIALFLSLTILVIVFKKMRKEQLQHPTN